jgi:hypothetical protein
MGALIQGAFLVVCVLVGAWVAFWGVVALHLARTRGASRARALLWCLVFGPLGGLIVVHATQREEPSEPAPPAAARARAVVGRAAKARSLAGGRLRAFGSSTTRRIP